MMNEHISLLVSATGLLLALHIGVREALAVVVGALFLAAMEKRDS